MALAFVVLVMLGAASVALAGDCISQPVGGVCLAYIPRYYYNAASRQCERFIYGGCGGNENNYKTIEECEQSCAHLTLEDCSAEPVTGMCDAYFPRFHFDAESGTCKKFTYGGCGGNKNNFHEESECQQRCGQYAKEEAGLTLEECSAEPETGMCRAYFPSYAFNPKTGKCEFFVYGGCGGNSNRFVSEEHCTSQCGKYAVLRTDSVQELTAEECSAEAETGMCRAYIPSYAFNPRTGKCEFFVYGGCGGNTNRFETEEHCLGQCGKYAALPDPVPEVLCTAEPEVGLCKAFIPSYFWNHRLGVCQPFIYGGCGGNTNRFQSSDECHQSCSGTPVTVAECSAQPEAGLCMAYFPSYFYNVTSGQCEEFVYGGCGGNGNRFQTLTACHATCAQAIPVVDERLAVGVCGQAKEVGMCRAAIPRYYYDVSTHSCQKFIYGGCGGNDNNFETIDECHNTCVA